jgi:catechol 2,3-dioxygenase-like lactoylglutathione lyase family enzyme
MLLEMDLNHLNLRVREPARCRDFYQRHFGFRPAFEAEGGYFMRNEHDFLLGLTPAIQYQPLPEGMHIGFGLEDADSVGRLHQEMSTAGVQTGELEDFRPAEQYVTFRCWDPDGTEVEVFWEPS